MPFVSSTSDPQQPGGTPPPLVQLRYFSIEEAKAEGATLPPGTPGVERIAGPLWQLTVPFGYVRRGAYFEVPAHTGNVAIYSNRTDLASVPGLLWGVLAPFGRQLRPALLHDHRCDLAHARQLSAEQESDPAVAVRLRQEALAIRKEADGLFRDALGDEKVGVGRRWIFWAGVSFGRFLGYQRLRGVLLAVAVALCTLVALHAVALSGHADFWAANRWLFALPFWTVLVAVFVVLWLYSRRPAIAVLLPLAALIVAVVTAGTGPHDGGWLHSWTVHAVVAGAALVVALLAGAATNVGVALIGVAVGPLLVPVIIVTVTVELLLALRDLGDHQDGAGGGLGPILPTLRMRLR